MQPSKAARIEPVGTCFTATKNFSVFTEYSPCRTSIGNCVGGTRTNTPIGPKSIQGHKGNRKEHPGTKFGGSIFIGYGIMLVWPQFDQNLLKSEPIVRSRTSAIPAVLSYFWGYHRQGSCQAGFSAAISKSGNRIFIGAPGSWYWQGQVYSIHTDATFPYKPPPYQDFGTGGQTYTYDVMDKRTKVYATGESYSTDDDSYLGYSMISGDFNGDGEEDVAVGMPRGAGLLGKVVIYRWNMANQFNVTGKQMGAYFGYSICTSDVDGDKLDDLIIGAPMYTEQNNEGKYDVGRVYILLQGQNGKFEKYNFRDGFRSKSRFGTAVTSLGDINQDGFGDFAIGAPYDGVFGRGAVYIYHGASEGPRKKYSQVIFAEDIKGGSFPRTFGFSLAGGMDMDGNIYPDLAVGAYDSDTVFIFKSRPVAVVDASTQFISVNKLINLDNKACVSRKDGKRVACAEIESCWRYEGVNVPLILDFDISWLLDSKNIKSPRMFFIDNEGKNIQNSSIRLEYGRKLCQKKTVYVIDNIRDKLTPLEVEVRYHLFDKIDSSLQRERRNILMPIIDQNRDTIQRDSLNIQKNCGIDNVCIPDLNLNIKTIDKFLLGSKVPLEIEVLITNKGEDAFETAFYASIPSDLDFKKIQQIGSSREPPITCTAPSYFTNYTLKCDIGNPFMKGTLVNFKIVMMPSEKIQMAPSYNFYMEVNSTNPEREGSNFDNVIKKSINVWIKTDVVVEGLSHPDGDHYKAAKFKFLDKATSENDLGPHLVHIYNVRNNGPSAVEEAILYIHWPHKTLSGKTLMYVMNKPEISGNIICDPNPYINSKNLDYDISLSSKSFLVSTGAIVKSATNFSSSGVKIEQSHKFISSQGIQATNRVLTEEEKQKFAEEDTLESTGDASLIHSERAKETSNRFDEGGVSIHSSSLWSSITNSDDQLVNYHKTGENKTFIYDETENSNLVQQTTNHHGSYDNMAPLNYDFSAANAHVSGYALNGDKNQLNLGGKMGNSGYEYSSNQNKYMSVEPYHQNYEIFHSSKHPGKILETYDYHGGYRSKRENSNNDYEKLEICKTVQCGTFRCVISNLGNNDGIWIAIRARLVAKTLESLAESVPINVSTLAIVQVTKLPYIGKPTENIIKSHEIYFKAIPEPIPPIDTVPLWVVVLSACAGAIILLLLIFLLYKCGFFNRNRPSNNCQERQPLNSRNGYHGDEHL